MTTEQIANYYKGATVNLGKDAIAFVEGLEDVIFWEDIFAKFAPNLKLEFFYETKFSTGKTGLNQALKFRNFVDKRFFICIDSDYSYLLQSDICKDEFVFHTYAYSIENHKCAPKNLNRLVKTITTIQSPLDFEVFLPEYGKIVYPLLCYLLYFEQDKLQKIAKGEFIVSEPLMAKKSITVTIGVSTSEIDIHNIETLLDRIEESINQLIAAIESKYGAIDLQPIEETLKELNVKPEDSFWFVNGHLFYNVIVKNLLEKIISSNVKQKRAKIQKIENETHRKNIDSQYKNHRERMNLHTLLNDHHKSCLAFKDSSPYLEQIGGDILRFWRDYFFPEQAKS